MSDKPEPLRFMNDEEFAQQLFLLRRTRRFLIEEGVHPDAAGIPPQSVNPRSASVA
jgi:hypothetical protein